MKLQGRRIISMYRDGGTVDKTDKPGKFIIKTDRWDPKTGTKLDPRTLPIDKEKIQFMIDSISANLDTVNNIKADIEALETK